jgi:hypothetical protein
MVINSKKGMNDHVTSEMKSLSIPRANILEVIFLNRSYEAFLDLVLESLNPIMSSGRKALRNSPILATS